MNELRILFVRICPNMYYFGSKQIYISLENNDNIIINFGGRKLDIDSFLE